MSDTVCLRDYYCAALGLRKQLNDLQDEITRLRAFMPADVLREYDRRYKGGS